MHLAYLVITCVVALVQAKQSSSHNHSPSSKAPLSSENIPEAVRETLKNMLSTIGTVDGQKNNAFLEAFESVADLGTTLTDVLIKLIQNEGEAEAVVKAAENALTDLRKGVNGLNLEESNMIPKTAHMKTPFLV